MKSPRIDLLRWARPGGVLLAGAALAAAVAASGAGGPPHPNLPDPLLLTIRAAPRLAMDRLPSPQTWIALDGARDGTRRVLTGGFWAASSPSVSYDARRYVFRGRQERRDEQAIWEMGVRGGNLRRITFGNGDPADPVYLPDGLILYSDELPEWEERETGARALFTCAPDGSDARRLTFGWHRDTRPEVLADGRVRFERRGLASGPESPPMLMTIHPDGTGVARRAGGPPSGSPPPGPASPASAEGEDRVLETTPAAPKPAPPILTSVVDDTSPTGTLLCLNAYASRLPQIAALSAGAIRRVRVTEAIAPPGPGKSGGSGRVLAEADVYRDGSFFVEVPADTPLRLDLLDAEGGLLGSLASGLWVRPNENRGCIGCHEDPHLVPENRVPLAIAHDAAPPAGTGVPGVL